MTTSFKSVHLYFSSDSGKFRVTILEFEQGCFTVNLYSINSQKTTHRKQPLCNEWSPDRKSGVALKHFVFVLGYTFDSRGLLLRVVRNNVKDILEACIIWSCEIYSGLYSWLKKKKTTFVQSLTNKLRQSFFLWLEQEKNAVTCEDSVVRLAALKCLSRNAC